MLGFIKRNRTLLAVLFSALLLRLWGVGHGLPHIYSVDEPALVRSVMGLRFDLNPHHFDWPHFHFYFGYFFFVLLVKFRALLQILNLRPLIESLVPIFWQDPQIFYLEMRVISALMGAATVGLVYLIGKRLFNRKTGLLAATFLAVYPFHNEISHYALLEAPLTFWITLSFLFSVLIFKNGRSRNCLLAGLFAGLAASAKYNGALVAVSIIVAHFLRLFPRSHVTCNRDCAMRQSQHTAVTRVCRGFGKLILAGLASIFGFLIGTPFALLDWQLFLSYEPGRGFLWQMARVGAVSWQELPRVLLERLGVLASGSGVVIAGLAGLGFLLVVKNRQRVGLLFLVFPLVYFLYIARLGYFNAHYLMPLAPFLSLLAASGLWFLLENVRRPPASLSAKLWRAGILCSLLLQPLFLSARSSFILSRPDTRQIASDWMVENVANGSKVAQRGEYQPVLSGFELVGTHNLSPDWLKKNKIDYVVVAGYGLAEYFLPKAALVKNIVPHLQPGPTILIFQTNLHTTNSIHGRYTSLL